MRLPTKFLSIGGIALVAGTVLVPSQAGAQAATQLCGDEPVTIMGTSDDDVIFGTSGPDVIFTGQGNDTIFGLGGDDIICAGRGDDIVVGGLGFDILFGAQGNDVLFSANGSGDQRTDVRGARMFGGAGNDLMVGSDRWDRMQGGPGIDHIDGYEGRDWIRGGTETDFVDGGAGIDDLHGGNGHDHMRGTTGDTLRGSNGNDLCDLRGTPDVFISCEESALAFATARTVPVTAPDSGGIEQTLDFFAEVFNDRVVTGVDGIFVPLCRIEAEVFEESYTFSDFAFGIGWAVDFEATSFGPFDPREELAALVDIRSTYVNANGNIVDVADDSDIPLEYRDGGWQFDLCSA